MSGLLSLAPNNLLIMILGMRNVPNSKLSTLLDGSPASLYWIGFLIADGHFSKKRMKLALAKKDRKHLKKFATWIKTTNWSNEKNCYSVSCRDTITVPLIKRKFDISNIKTTHPPELPELSDDQFLSLYVGFFDGDGSMKVSRGRRCMSFQIHSNWLRSLTCWTNRIYKIIGEVNNKPKINKRGYTLLNISGQGVIYKLRHRIEELGLPVLARKWNRVSRRYPRAMVLEDRARFVGNNPDLTLKDISRRLNLKYTTLYRFSINRGLRTVLTR